ncbi:MAG: tetratricopeptide repeat protein [Magnetococcales bacterium]|nr:tetratricopeptide repeat protein [Magnetococcales bacterium]
MVKNFKFAASKAGKASWILVALLLVLALPDRAEAFFSELKYATEEMGKREVLSFYVPPGAARPRVKMLEEKKLELTVFGLLALPSTSLNTKRSRWIKSFVVNDIPGGKMGLSIIIDLKEPLLDFRDSIGKDDVIKGSLYRLEIEKLEKPTQTGPAKLLEGKVLVGRDGTLIVFAHTGNGFVESNVDKESNLVGLHWRSAQLGSSWRDVVPGGLVEKILAYEFPRGQVELEIILHDNAQNVRFHRGSKIGLFIVEVVQKNGMGRGDDIGRIMQQRRRQMDEGNPWPLNRLTPLFIPSGVSIEIADQIVNEEHFMEAAKDAEEARDFAKARGLLDNLLKIFPNTENREIIDFYKVNLANKMDWKPGWVLTELEAAMARHPNNSDYSNYRLLQLKLYNDAMLYGSAANIMWDPNLPKGLPEVWLERGRTAIGLARSQVSSRTNHDAATGYLKKIIEVTRNKGPFSAEAQFLLAELSDNDGEMDKTLEILDNITKEQLAFLNKNPDRIMGMADMYYKYTRYTDAVRHYATLLENYPSKDRMIPWALLRAAESNHQLSKIAKAAGDTKESEARLKETKQLFERLSKIHIASDAAVWGKIFELSLNENLDVDSKIKKLDELIKNIAMPDALAEAQLSSADLLGQSARHFEALNTLNELLTLTSRSAVVRRANRLRKKYLVEGMEMALEEGRPEFSALLAEVYGENWRRNPKYIKPRIHLAEALMRMGAAEGALPLIEGIEEAPAPALIKLGKAIVEGSYLGLPVISEIGSKVSPAVARVRLDESERLVELKDWESVLILLERLPADVLNEAGREKRLRLLAKAEAGRGRFPQTVRHLEDLFFQKPLGDGKLYYWYGTILQKWKGDDKALSTYQRVAEEANEKEVQALALVRIGDILQRKGDFPGAKEKYLKAAELAPETAWAKVSTENAAQLQMAMDIGK